MERHLFEVITQCTAPITAFRGGQPFGSGTGFLYVLATVGTKSVVGLITNKHVLEGADVARIVLTEVDDSGDEEHRYYDFAIHNSSVLYHPNQDVDLCALLVSEAINGIESRKKAIRHSFISEEIVADRAAFEQLLPLEPVTMIGYPIAIWDNVNNGAVARRGVIASAPNKNFQGRPEFLIDMACMPGSSGSPVFIADSGTYSTRNETFLGGRVMFLGVLWGGPQQEVSGEIVPAPIPMRTERVLSQIPTNLGFVIKATELQPLVGLAMKLFDQSSQASFWKPGFRKLDF